MPQLTPTELAQLEAIQNLTLQEFKDAYASYVADTDSDPETNPNSAAKYYQYLSDRNFANGGLALGVVNNNTDQGEIANEYARLVAEAGCLQI